jgi:hypothetical protein
LGNTALKYIDEGERFAKYVSVDNNNLVKFARRGLEIPFITKVSILFKYFSFRSEKYYYSFSVFESTIES